MSYQLRSDILALLSAGCSIAVIADHVGKSQWEIARWLVNTRAIRKVTP